MVTKGMRKDGKGTHQHMVSRMSNSIRIGPKGRKRAWSVCVSVDKYSTGPQMVT